MYTLDANPPVFPPEDCGALRSVLAHLPSGPPRPVTVVASGQRVTVPDEVVEAILQVVTAMLDGQAVIVMPVHCTLTTGQAANLLGIPRRDFIDLLDESTIPYRQSGRHRRVELADVLAYHRQHAAERREALKRVTEISSEANLYELCATPASVA